MHALASQVGRAHLVALLVVLALLTVACGADRATGSASSVSEQRAPLAEAPTAAEETTPSTLPPAPPTTTTTAEATRSDETRSDETLSNGTRSDGTRSDGTPPATTSQSGDRTCIDHNGLERCWLTFVPANVTSPAPLVIDFHGWTSNAATQRSFSGFDDLADNEGFVAVWPDGYRSSWNAGGCCPPANSDAIDDVDFTRQLVLSVAETTDVDLDLDRVYVTGLSNGCAMAQRMAADASDLVAAVACMSFYLLDEADDGYTPVPVMELHGTADSVVAYNRSLFDGALQNSATWAKLNRCSGAPEETWRSDASVALTYTQCESGAEVTLVTIDQGGHLLYEGSGTTVDTTELAWEFLSRFGKGS